MFSTSNPQGPLTFLDALEGRVMTTMNEELLWDFTKEEVAAALWQMHPTKAPWLDGMPPLLFQKDWHMVGM